MAVKGLFGTSLNELTKLPNLLNRYCRDTWIWKGMIIDRKWRNGDKGNTGVTGALDGTGKYMVHFEAGQRSSIQANGELVPKGKMAQPTYVRGSIDYYKRFATAISMNQEDIWQQMNPTQRDTYITYKASTEMERNKKNFMHQLTYNMLNGRRWMKATATGTSGGKIKVDMPANTTIGERLDLVTEVAGGTSTKGDIHLITKDCWVRNIDINERELTLYNARTGGSAVNTTLHATVTGNDNNTDRETYLALPGVVEGNVGSKPTDNGFTSLRDQVFTVAKGGGKDSLFGQDKKLYPYLQTILHDGTGVNSMQKFIEAVTRAYFDLVMHGQPIGVAPGNSTNNVESGNMSIMGRNTGRVQAVMSLEWFYVLQRYFMENRGSYFKQTTGKTVNYFDSSRFTFTAVEGTVLDAVGVKAMPNDIVYIIGTGALRFATLNLIQTYKSPMDGVEWFIDREDSTGRNYILDLSFYGDLILQRPAGVAGIYGLDSNPIKNITT